MTLLLLRLEAPLLSFGGVAVDQRGMTDALPSASLLTGLIGNALGWRRSDVEALQRLQDRIRYAVRVDRRGERIQDFQTAQLSGKDHAWTTRGAPIGRDGGANTYDSPHLRYRDFHADASVLVALGLEPEAESPTPDAIATALRAPARPLFIGRKPCVPSTPLLVGMVESNDFEHALRASPVCEDADPTPRYFVHGAEPSDPRGFGLAGRRTWAIDTHQGSERWRELTCTAPNPES